MLSLMPVLSAAAAVGTLRACLPAKQQFNGNLQRSTCAYVSLFLCTTN
jgi:hypothetical protein